MTPDNFTYWLQGFFEIANPKVISAQQLQEIRNHLKIVKNRVEPQYCYPHIKTNPPFSQTPSWTSPQIDCSTDCKSHQTDDPFLGTIAGQSC